MAGAALGRTALVAAAISALYLVLAYGSLRLSFEWFPPRDWRHDTDPTWVLPIALYAPLVLAAAAVRVVTGRMTAAFSGRQWALSALLASLLMMVFWRRWLSDGVIDLVQGALGVGVFFAFIGPGLWLGGWCRTSLLRTRGAREPLRPTAHAYPMLEQLMAACFHQDYDVEGETVAEVVAAFRIATPPDQRARLRAEIAAFIAAYPDDLDRAFESTFRPHVIVAAFSGSTLEFLRDVDEQLEA